MRDSQETITGRMEVVVDQVIGAFEMRRRKRWSPTRQPLTVTDPRLRRWHQIVEEYLKAFCTSTVDRGALLDRVHERFSGKEWAVDFARVADELQNMAREDLRQFLVDNGMAAEPALRIAAGYSVGALLHGGRGRG